MWERVEIDNLVLHIAGQHASSDATVRRHRTQVQVAYGDEERAGKRARVQTATGSPSEAMIGVVGGVVNTTIEERMEWTETLIPRSEEPTLAHPERDEQTAAAATAWGKGDVREAKAAMQEVGRQKNGFPSLPHVKMPPLSAPGQSGDRQEHLDAVVDFWGAGQRRRLFRALDQLTIRWAIGDLPDC